MGRIIADGQIISIFLIDRSWGRFEEYLIKGDSVIINEYISWDIQDSADWDLYHKTILKIDTTFTKNQIQIIPEPAYEEEGLLVNIDFHLLFDYGKVLSATSYSVNDDGSLELEEFAEYFYSPASVLSGDGIIAGFINEELTGNKSIIIGSQVNGNPVEGAVVSLCALNDNFVLATDTTSATGYYEFKGVPNGEYYLKVYLPGFEQVSTYNLELKQFSNVFRNKDFVVQNDELFTNLNPLENEIKIYPNPASEYVDIVSSEEITSVKIFNSSGQLLLIQDSGKFLIKRISVNDFSQGIYFMEVKTNTKIYRQKLIVN